MAIPRFIMVGGFLGAGKTTTIARLAKHYQAQQQKVAIVTNDQATDLVDTLSLRSQGFEVGEVPGSCFCCNFNALTDTVEGLCSAERPDVVIAEPVGSCTDLVATVIRPLEQIYQQPFDIAPYGVILKPSHGEKILKNLSNSGFSPKAAYIFRKQIEEADFVILNRIDQIRSEQVAELTGLISEQFPGRSIIPISARTGVGFESLVEQLAQRGTAGKVMLELDYDVYAEGEAELGWLNASLRIIGDQPFSMDRLLLDLVSNIHQRVAESSAEVAHLKIIGMADSVYGVANLVASHLVPELSLASNGVVREAQLVINARVATDPQALTGTVHAAVDAVCRSHSVRAELGQTQSFRPGRPVPTHRILDQVR